MKKARCYRDEEGRLEQVWLPEEGTTSIAGIGARGGKQRTDRPLEVDSPSPLEYDKKPPLPLSVKVTSASRLGLDWEKSNQTYSIEAPTPFPYPFKIGLGPCSSRSTSHAVIKDFSRSENKDS